MAQDNGQAGGPPRNPQYSANYGQARRAPQNPHSFPTNYEQAGRAPQNTQSYYSNYEQADSASQNPESYSANNRQAGRAPQNPQSYRAIYGQAEGVPPIPQPYPENYGAAGWTPHSSQLYSANNGQAGGVAQNPQVQPTKYGPDRWIPQSPQLPSANYGQAGGVTQNPQVQPTKYGQASGAPQNPQSYPAASGQAAGPAQNPQLNPQNYRNPKTAFFTVLFKGCAIVFYIFCGWFTSSFVIHFVIISMLMAFDFWTVKNVSGRILVGMRWWNDVDEQGESVWRFESLDQETLARMNANDSWLFWSSLYISCAVWVVFGVVSLLKFSFDYLLLVSISLSFCSANIIGFTKCRKDAKQKIRSFAQSAAAAGVREAMTGGITRSLQKSLGL